MTLRSMVWFLISYVEDQGSNLGGSKKFNIVMDGGLGLVGSVGE